MLSKKFLNTFEAIMLSSIIVGCAGMPVNLSALSGTLSAGGLRQERLRVRFNLGDRHELSADLSIPGVCAVSTGNALSWRLLRVSTALGESLLAGSAKLQRLPMLLAVRGRLTNQFPRY